MPSGRNNLGLSLKARRRLRTLARVTLAGFAVLCLMAATAFWVATRSWFIIRIITPKLEQRLGGEVTIGEAAYQGDGRIKFHNLLLRAPGLNNEAGEITHIQTAVITLDVGRLLSGHVNITGVEVNRATLRLSESRDERGLLNIWSLTPDWSDRNKRRMPPPLRITIQNAAIEFGFHDDQGFHLMGSRLVSGEMRPTPGAPNLYSFVLSEVDSTGIGIPNGISMKGEWNAESNEWSNRIDGIELDDRIYRMCPEMVRTLWEEMNLQGKVQSVEMHWSPDQSFYIQMQIEDVALTLPVETTIKWARYRGGNVEETSSRPRMHFNSGLIRITHESLELIDMVGALGSADQFDDVLDVPYRISFSLQKIPPMEWDQREQWGENILKFAPFSLQYKTEDFRLVRDWRGEVPAIDLPLFIANVLERFQVTNCVLTTSLDVTRPEAPLDEHGNPIEVRAQVNGTTYLHNASGRYQKFPYRLENVDAYLQFDNEKVTVHYLTGSGSGDSKMRIWGEIKPPDNDAAVDLRVTGVNVPVDDRLREALKGNELAAFDMMFNRPAGDSLAASGLLPDEAAIARAKAELEQAIARRDQLRANAVADERGIAMIDAEIARLKRSVDAGPFVLGGNIDIDLNIQRDPGRDKPTIITGKIDVRNVGLLYDRFPYPLRVTGGTLDWQRDRVVIVGGAGSNGLSLVTPGGGHGSATGELVFHGEKGHKILPNLQITIDDDSFNDAVYAAIPLTESERKALSEDAPWPGHSLAKAAQFVKGLGLRGSASYRGAIFAADDQRINYEFVLTLNQCSAMPTAELARLVGASAPLWSDGFTINNVGGEIQVSRDAINIEQITGAAGDTTLQANGRVNLTAGHVENLLNIHLQNLTLDENVLNLARGEQLDRAREIWNQFEPAGTYDAILRYHAKANDASFDAKLVPRSISFALADGKRITATRREGDARAQEGFIEFRQLLLDLENERGIAEGTLRLNGMCNLNQGAESYAVHGEMTGARMEAGYVAHLMRSLAGEKVTQRYVDAQPVGSFNARFDAIGARDSGPAQWQVDIEPHTAGFQWNGRPVLTTFDGGAITIDSQQILVSDLRGRHSEGEFAVEGRVMLSPTIDAQFTISHTGQVRSDVVEAFLPNAALATLDHMKFLDFGPTTMEQATLRITRSAAGDDDIDIAFDGPIRTTSASLDPGVQFHGVAGAFRVRAQSSGGKLTDLRVNATIDSAQALGQNLSSIEAYVTLDEDGETVVMPSFRAESEDGAIAATAWTKAGDGGEYRVNIDLVDVPLNRLGDRPPTATTTGSPRVARRSADRSTGDLFANFSISGRRGDPQSRTGRASVRVVRGNMVNVPLLMQLMQVVQLSMPLAGNFDFADAEMYIQGDRVIFEHILFESTMGDASMLQLFGEGEMNFDTLELNTRFRSRGSTPILRDIMGEIGDVLYCIEVTGTLSDPKARIVPLPDSN